MKLSDSKVEIVKRGNKVVYHDGERLVKVFNSEKPAADVFNEALNNARVEGTGVRAAEILEVSRVEEGEHKGSWALATRFIPGKTLHELAAADASNADRYLTQLVDLQAEIHSFEAPLLNRQKDKLARMISRPATTSRCASMACIRAPGSAMATSSHQTSYSARMTGSSTSVTGRMSPRACQRSTRR